MDRLNRQWAELSKNGEDENSGPMEAKKANLKKQCEEVDNSITQIQKDWIQNQTELIEQ